MSKKGSKSDLIYLHKKSHTTIDKGKKHAMEEQVVKTNDGLKFKLFVKEGDKIEKIIGIQKPDGSFDVIFGNNKDKTTQKMTKAEVLKMVEKDKRLHFALEPVKTGGAKRKSKSKKRIQKEIQKRIQKRT